VLIAFILRENPNALTPIVLMPSLMLVFCKYRANSGFDIMEDVAHKTARVVEVVNEVVTRYTLIADYQQRPQMCELFAEKTSELCEAKIPVEVFRNHNNYFPKWLGPIFTASYIAAYTTTVISGGISVGTFLATIKVFTELSGKFAEGYSDLMKIMASFVPLRKLTYLLNMETDLLFWKNVNRKRRELSKMARLECLHTAPKKETGETSPLSPPVEKDSDEPAPMRFRTDEIELKLRGMCFSWQEDADYGEQLLSNVSLSCPQGQLISVIGSHGSGKSTLLRLIGHNLFPLDGMVFIPTHLRILHVGPQPLLLQLSTWRNLVFGRPHAVPDRVRAICKELHMPQTLELMEKDLIALKKNSPKMFGTGDNGDEEDDEEDEGDEDEDGGEEDDSWQEKLSSTEMSKIHLARALIMNPEVLVLHRPLSNYDNKNAERIMNVLKRHVSNRGFHVPEEGRNRRRPRSVFFTASTPKQAMEADIIWRVNGVEEEEGRERGSVDVITKEEMRKEFLRQEEESRTFEASTPK